MDATAQQPTAETPGPRSLRAEVMLIATTVIWGGTFACTKLLLEEVPPMCLLSWRFGTAALIFLIVFHRRLPRIAQPGTLAVGACLGVLLYGGFALQTAGLDLTSSSRSGFITALYVIITPLIQVILTRHLPSRTVMLGLGLVLIGLWGLTAPGGSLGGLIEPWSAGGFGTGDLLTLGCAALFAVYIIVLDRFAGVIDPAALTAVQLVTTATLALTHSLITEPFHAPSTTSGWLNLAFLSIFASVISTYWQTRYQRGTTPTRAAVIYTMESVFAAIIGVLFLAEHLGPVAVAGGALIVTGLLTVELKHG